MDSNDILDDKDNGPEVQINFPSSVMSRIEEMMGGTEQFDSAEFDAVAYINRVFPTEQSLSGVESAASRCEFHLAGVEHDIRRLVRAQAEQREAGQNALLEAQRCIAELALQVADINKKAERSESMVREITSEIKQLDCAKSNLTAAITALNHLHMLVGGVDKLRTMTRNRQYKEIVLPMQAIMEVLHHFECYREIRELSSLRDQVHAIRTDLASQIRADFKDAFTTGSKSTISHRTLSEACGVVDILEPKVKQELLKWFINVQLQEYQHLFSPEQECAWISFVERRYAWLKRHLLAFEESLGNVFPHTWKLSEAITQQFCKMTKTELSNIMASRRNEVDVKLLLYAIQKTYNFELLLHKRFIGTELGAEPVDIGVDKQSEFDADNKDGAVEPEAVEAGSPAGSGPASPWVGLIGSCFEPYLSLYISSLDANLRSLCDRFIQDAKTPPSAGDTSVNTSGAVISSCADLFLFYKKCLVQCARLTTGEPMLELGGVFQKYLREYAHGVLQGVLPRAAGAAALPLGVPALVTNLHTLLRDDGGGSDARYSSNITQIRRAVAGRARARHQPAHAAAGRRRRERRQVRIEHYSDPPRCRWACPRSSPTCTRCCGTTAAGATPGTHRTLLRSAALSLGVPALVTNLHTLLRDDGGGSDARYSSNITQIRRAVAGRARARHQPAHAAAGRRRRERRQVLIEHYSDPPRCRWACPRSSPTCTRCCGTTAAGATPGTHRTLLRSAALSLGVPALVTNLHTLLRDDGGGSDARYSSNITQIRRAVAGRARARHQPAHAAAGRRRRERRQVLIEHYSDPPRCRWACPRSSPTCTRCCGTTAAGATPGTHRTLLRSAALSLGVPALVTNLHTLLRDDGGGSDARYSSNITQIRRAVAGRARARHQPAHAAAGRRRRERRQVLIEHYSDPPRCRWACPRSSPTCTRCCGTTAAGATPGTHRTLLRSAALSLGVPALVTNLHTLLRDDGGGSDARYSSNITQIRRAVAGRARARHQPAHAAAGRRRRERRQVLIEHYSDPPRCRWACPRSSPTCTRCCGTTAAGATPGTHRTLLRSAALSLGVPALVTNLHTLLRDDGGGSDARYSSNITQIRRAVAGRARARHQPAHAAAGRRRRERRQVLIEHYSDPPRCRWACPRSSPTCTRCCGTTAAGATPGTHRTLLRSAALSLGVPALVTNLHTLLRDDGGGSDARYSSNITQIRRAVAGRARARHQPAHAAAGRRRRERRQVLIEHYSDPPRCRWACPRSSPTCTRCCGTTAAGATPGTHRTLLRSAALSLGVPALVTNLHTLLRDDGGGSDARYSSNITQIRRAVAGRARARHQPAHAAAGRRRRERRQVLIKHYSHPPRCRWACPRSSPTCTRCCGTTAAGATPGTHRTLLRSAALSLGVPALVTNLHTLLRDDGGGSDARYSSNITQIRRAVAGRARARHQPAHAAAGRRRRERRQVLIEHYSDPPRCRWACPRSSPTCTRCCGTTAAGATPGTHRTLLRSAALSLGVPALVTNLHTLLRDDGGGSDARYSSNITQIRRAVAGRARARHQPAHAAAGRRRRERRQVLIKHYSEHLREISKITSVITTSEYCLETTIHLEQKLKEKVSPGLADKIDMTPEQDLFHKIINNCIQMLVQDLELACEPALQAMTKISWLNFDNVGDQSSYVTQIIMYLKNAVPNLRDNLSSSRKYFTQFCIRFANSFIPKFIQNIYKCKPISTVGSEQLLLDTHMLKTALLELPSIGSEVRRPAPATYTKVVIKLMTKAEMILKLVMAPLDGNLEGFVSQFVQLLPECTLAEFHKVLDMKGAKLSKAQQSSTDALFKETCKNIHNDVGK
ncbi:unnamed protein product [Arctia plantaginis]|uniref:Vacuolar protein sorting-associated protein 53 homolog n=1 Tax=Arctia plantaginis TaxID=874455 RepID=A0A8S0YRG7_ARCPL|nr:unnamed protein product [Arctia plantaginis]